MPLLQNDWLCVAVKRKDKPAYCCDVDAPGLAEWVESLPPSTKVNVIPVKVRDSILRVMLVKIPLKVFTKLRGTVWGACEGSVTGMATGSNVSGCGWWIAGSVCQVVGGLCGLVIGTPVFAVLGLLSDMNTIRELLTDYRHAFSKLETIRYDNRITTALLPIDGQVPLANQRTKINGPPTLTRF